MRPLHIPHNLVVAAALIIVCIVLRHPLEGDPVTHVLVQLPVLALAGWFGGQSLTIGEGAWNRGGVAALLIALFAIAFWMIPRSIDAALQSPAMNIAKFVSVPVLIGAPLALGWPRAHPLLRGFLKAEAISMLGVLAFLYTHAPFRICNAYLVNDQERLGYGFLFAAFGVALIWIIPLFKTKTQKRPAHLKLAPAQCP